MYTHWILRLTVRMLFLVVWLIESLNSKTSWLEALVCSWLLNAIGNLFSGQLIVYKIIMGGPYIKWKWHIPYRHLIKFTIRSEYLVILLSNNNIRYIKLYVKRFDKTYSLKLYYDHYYYPSNELSRYIGLMNEVDDCRILQLFYKFIEIL